MKLKVNIWKYSDRYLLLMPVDESGKHELRKLLDCEVIVKLNNIATTGVVRIARYGKSKTEVPAIRIDRKSEFEKLIRKTVTIDVLLARIEFEESADLVDVRIQFTKTFYNMLKIVAEKLNTTPEDYLQSFLMNHFIPIVDQMYKLVVKKT